MKKQRGRRETTGDSGKRVQGNFFGTIIATDV